MKRLDRPGQSFSCELQISAQRGKGETCEASRAKANCWSALPVEQVRIRGCQLAQMNWGQWRWPNLNGASCRFQRMINLPHGMVDNTHIEGSQAGPDRLANEAVLSNNQGRQLDTEIAGPLSRRSVSAPSHPRGEEKRGRLFLVDHPAIQVLWHGAAGH